MRPECARSLAQQLLAEDLPQRWQHVQAVAARAQCLGQRILPASQAAWLEAAAWLHDIGYAPALMDTGFHPLDGARWLRLQQVDARLCALVAHHSCAAVQAQHLGLLARLAEFEREASLVADALTLADMTTGPAGQALDIHARMAEIHARYGAGHPVSVFITQAAPELLAQAGRVEAALIGRITGPG